MTEDCLVVYCHLSCHRPYMIAVCILILTIKINCHIFLFKSIRTTVKKNKTMSKMKYKHLSYGFNVPLEGHIRQIWQNIFKSSRQFPVTSENIFICEYTLMKISIVLWHSKCVVFLWYNWKNDNYWNILPLIILQNLLSMNT
jgi:hypothetical protein